MENIRKLDEQKVDRGDPVVFCRWCGRPVGRAFNEYAIPLCETHVWMTPDERMYASDPILRALEWFARPPVITYQGEKT